ncbi:aldehyde dehydrogenase family protein, partial [Actinotalea ferrariae]|nr:aldehyde dehydrogenase family protein [Actinotalea ferrariae]
MVPAAGTREVRRTDPVTGAPGLVLVPGTASEVDAAVTAAWEARHAWRRTAPAERAAALATA